MLDAIGKRPFASTFSLENVLGRYTGTTMPLEGLVTIKVSRDEIGAEIANSDNWEMRSLRAVPGGIIGSPGELFRPLASGFLIGDSSFGAITPESGGWVATRSLYVGASHSFEATASADKYCFSVGELVVDGPAPNATPVAVRQIYSRGDWFGHGSLDEHILLVYALIEKPSTIDDETLGVVCDWLPDDVQSEGIWNMLSFISGNTLKHLADEYYDETRTLVRTVYRLGARAEDKRRLHFDSFRGPLADDGVGVLSEGFSRLMRVMFPIEVVLQHLLESAGRSEDIEAQHLTLAIHTAIEGWNRLFGRDNWIKDGQWKRLHRKIRKTIPPEISEKLSDEMLGNVQTALAHANRTTTAWRQREFFKALQIDVSDDESTRVLKMRDELLHNGYFVRRWTDTSHAEMELRYRDILRLRRLVLLIIFRLTGYRGTYVNPLTYQSEFVEAYPLPEILASRHGGAV